MEFAMSLFLISVICVSQVFASDNFNKVLKLRGRIAQCRASCMEKVSKLTLFIIIKHNRCASFTNILCGIFPSFYFNINELQNQTVTISRPTKI